MPRPYGTRSRAHDSYARPLGEPGQRRVKLVANVEPEVHERAHRIALAMNVSASRLVSLLVERIELDRDGRPVWADQAGLPAQPPLADDPPAGRRLSA